VADQQKEKSPEELGEAVGRKIEALFGGFFDDEATQLLDAEDTFKKDTAGAQAAPPKPPKDTATIEIPPPSFASAAPAKPVPPPTPAKPSVAPPSPAEDTTQPFDAVAELVEALILNLEWEVTPEVIDEVAERFKELDSHFPRDSQARSILSMNYRILQRFKAPDAGSHPSLVNLLQDSLTCLKLMRSSPGNRQSIDSLFAGISNMYKLISAATEQAGRPEAPAPRPTPPPPPIAPPPAPVKASQPLSPPQRQAAPVRQPAPAAKPVARPAASPAPRAVAAPAAQVAPALKKGAAGEVYLPERVGAAVRSLEDMVRRLTRVVGVLRQDGDLAGEEITTDTLERMLAGADSRGGVGVDKEYEERYKTLMKNTGGAIQNLEEVGQRFSRILGVFRQGGDMSGEEIIRRLGTLEHLLADRLGKLSSFHKQLTDIPLVSGPREVGGSPAVGKGTPDGLLTIVWAGTALAIPSSMVMSIFPMTKVQGEQIQEKASLVLSGRTVHRLPLKKPPAAAQYDAPVPTWLVHITVGQKDYFLLADRSLGYRRAPDGVDVARQQRINLAGTSYLVLNQASFQ
jgi:hypothetical protein